VRNKVDSNPESVFVAWPSKIIYRQASGEPAMSHAKSEEIDRNLERLSEILPDLIPDHERQYALMRDGTVVDFFDEALDAQIEGNRQFEDCIFSIQCLQDVAEQLGYFSYAVAPGKS
jgi:hypothetical protein